MTARDEHRNATLAAIRELDNLATVLGGAVDRAAMATHAVDVVTSGSETAAAVRAVELVHAALENLRLTLDQTGAARDDLQLFSEGI